MIDIYVCKVTTKNVNIIFYSAINIVGMDFFVYICAKLLFYERTIF